MPAFTCFEEIDGWKVARVLNEEIWRLISANAFGKDWALADQINRAGGSIMDNIAEGFDSGTDAEFIRFLRYAQRSVSEVKSQLYRALDRKHIDNSDFDCLQSLATESGNKVGGLIKYLKNCS